MQYAIAVESHEPRSVDAVKGGEDAGRKSRRQIDAQVTGKPIELGRDVDGRLLQVDVRARGEAESSGRVVRLCGGGRGETGNGAQGDDADEAAKAGTDHWVSGGF